ncbi:metal ABC transporter solute-binding protein, Zn/Mn family [Roseicella aerolata]|uniref:Zinc ABC transporter substrate-binding protein n=1 Tax=Roseicella aerolata TaxID=2883479 RepID=A0A9X1IG88_9PROT|nr:zinc ABC transporter substrate-binding protein [Roseicella aerolata]MCB4823589.1 zinc ABC transporter substrate-binding protein [Roseicella aerolata]
MRRRLLLTLAAASAALPAAHRQVVAQTPRADARLPVTASFSILGDMVREVGGGRVAIRSIAGPEADPHLFQPRPSDVQAIQEARLVVRNGLAFEPWFDRLIRSAGYAGPVVTTTDGVQPRGMENHEHGHDHGDGVTRRRQHYVPPRQVADPHCWQDLRLGQAYVRSIASGLAAADPAGADLYRRNADAYLQRLAALDGWVRAQIATVPPARRKVVTSHDALGYFGDAYGVRFLPAQGIMPEGQPSAAQVAALIRQVRAEGITAVFLDAPGSAPVLRRLAEEAGVRVSGRLYADALSPPDGPAPNYEAMFRHNVGLLVPAMRGNA